MLFLQHSFMYLKVYAVMKMSQLDPIRVIQGHLCTQGSRYRYSTDNDTPLSDSQSVQNLSIHTSLSVLSTDKEARASAFVPIMRPGGNVQITGHLVIGAYQ